MNRLRGLAERPVDAGVARAILVSAFAVTVGLGCLVALGLGAHREPPAGPGHAKPRAEAAVPSPPPAEAPADRTRRRDLLDRPGTTAHRRAAHELASHRALQHVPWSRGGVAIRLVGALDGKAILSVVGPSVGGVHGGYRAFLHRFRDDGRSYLPRFEVAGGGRS